jgi:two-component system nitrate/nitrite sensor histidine kinase NarX
MWVPLAVKGEIIGGIAVAHTELDHFTAHHADLALTMANQAAIIMINAQLHERAQAVAVLEERQRLAQNLHDAINQSLFSAGLIAEVLPRLWDRDPEEALQSLEDLRRLTRGAQAEMRGLLVELKPLILTDSVLADLLHQLGNALTGRINIPVIVTVMGPEQQSLPAKVQVAFYRICQEALHNIIKHAQATQVEIKLKIEPGTIELIIRDDGRGFDPSHIPSGHYGLTMMKERAQAVNAVLTITGQPGQGTVVVISWTNDLVQEHL